MTTTAMTIFENGPLPAHIAAANEELANVTTRATVNALTFEGKVWTINLNGKKTKLMKTNAEGEEEPVSIFTAIVLGFNDRGREFYIKPYDPKNPTIPDCWSEDSKAPHANVPSPCAKTCAACPNSKKGSATTQAGGATTACGQFKKLALVPNKQVGVFPPLRLKMKITSIYDKDGADKHPGWYAWDQYMDLLTSKGVRSTGVLPTKIKFDKDVAYPKLLFAPGASWLDDDTVELVKGMMLGDEMKELLANTYDPSTSTTGNKPLPDDDGNEIEVAAAVPAQARAKPAPKAPPVAEEDEEVVAVAPAKPRATPAKADPAPVAEEDEVVEVVLSPEQQAAARRAERAAATAATANKAVARAAKTAAAPAPTEDDDDGDTAVAAPVKPKTTVAAAKPPATGGAKPTGKGAPLDAPPEVADLLGNWDD